MIKYADDSKITGNIKRMMMTLCTLRIWIDLSNDFMISIYIWMFLKRKKCVLILENEEVTLNLFWWNGKSWQSTCKYLGVGFDKKLSWNENTSHIIKKANTKMCYLMKLKSFGVSTSLLVMFNDAVECSFLSFGIVCWRGNFSKQELVS